jgi:immunoglobulin-like protein involved in spore germination/sporulation and spore germination protein
MRARLVIVLAVMPLAACGSSGGSRSTATPTEPLPAPPRPSTATETSPLPTPALIFFLRDGKLAAARRAVSQARGIEAAAVQAVLRGPDAEERQAGLTTALHRGARLKSLSIRGGVAKVSLALTDRRDFSNKADAQLVYTLTEFPAVGAVNISADFRSAHEAQSDTMNGNADRSTYEPLTPAILIESPVVGDSVTSPLHVSGTANTFEATFQLEVRTGGRLIDKRTVTATSGSGVRGTFGENVPFTVSEETPARVIAYELSAENGRRINQVSVPIGLLP